MNQQQIESSLLRIRPGAEWSLQEAVLTWLDEQQAEPTETEIAEGWAVIEQEAADREVARASALAKLAALGLTEAEAVALFGI